MYIYIYIICIYIYIYYVTHICIHICTTFVDTPRFLVARISHGFGISFATRVTQPRCHTFHLGGADERGHLGMGPRNTKDTSETHLSLLEIEWS